MLALLFCFAAYAGPVFTPSADRVADDLIDQHRFEVLKSLDRLGTRNAVAGKGASLLPGLNSPASSLPSSLTYYFEGYGFQRIQGTLSWAMMASQGFDILTLKVVPPQPNGKLVLFTHGFMDHTGGYTNFFEELASQGYTVVTYDLPGHGLSSGDFASIDDFETYARILADVLNQFSSGYQDVTLAGFSTGGSTVLEARRLGLVDPKLRALLISPLVRVAYWRLLEPAFRAGYFLTNEGRWPFLNALLAPQTQVTPVSHDELFLKILALDPLRPLQIPSQWTNAYVNFAGRLDSWGAGLSAEAKKAFGPTLVIQGEEDSVVDGDAGVAWLKKTFPELEVVWIAEGRHQLLNEGIVKLRRPARQMDILPYVFHPIFEFLAR